MFDSNEKMWVYVMINDNGRLACWLSIQYVKNFSIDIFLDIITVIIIQLCLKLYSLSFVHV